VSGPTTITVQRTLTITAFEGTRIISRDQDDPFVDQMFIVSGAGNLTLGHPQGGTLILDGGADWDTQNPPVNHGVPANGPLVEVQNARLTIHDGAILRNNHNTDTPYGGGGVYVYANNGNATLTMSGGSISENRAHNGGGVCVFGDNNGNATLTMSGGSISENRAQGGGGVGVFGDNNGNATLTMSGGAILRNNHSSNPIGGGGGVYVSNGSFTMNGGTLTLNTATNYGGVLCGGSFIMSGGNISGNTTTGGGGGVYSNGSFTMSGSAAVDTGNPVRLESGTVITLSGALTANPAANIVPAATSPGTPVLGGDITIDDNYKKFQLNGVSNKIGSSGEILPP
jgi:hypothetical protein